MRDSSFRISLDIHDIQSQVSLPIKKGDTARRIYINLTENSMPYSIEKGCVAVFSATKPDGTKILNDCIIKKDRIRYDVTEQTSAIEGIVQAEIILYGADKAVLTSPRFTLVVDDRAIGKTPISADEKNVLNSYALAEAERVKNEEERSAAFNNLGIDLEDDGEVISIVKTDIDGSQEKSTFLKYSDVIPSITASASGSAITIESANAPLQNLKLFGKTEQNGTPTPDAPVPLVSVGDSGSFVTTLDTKNLLNVPQEITAVATGHYFKALPVNLSEGKYTFSFVSNYKLVGNEQFIVSTPNNEIITSPTVYTNANTVKAIQFTIEKSGEYLFTFYTAQGGTITNAQLEIGTQATPYEPYNKQTLTMPYTLRSNKSDLADEIDFMRGIGTQKIGIRIIKGTENFSYDSNTKRFYWYFTTGASNTGVKLSTHYTQGETGVGATSQYAFNIDAGAIYIRDERFTNVTDFKTWLSSNNVTIYYPLATPIETPLTEVELNAYRQLVTNKGTTNILSEADAEVEYYTPYGQALGNIHSQVNKDYFKLTQAIISTGGN